MLRKTLIPLSVILLLASSAARAQSTGSWVGQRVITKYGTVLKVRGVVVDDADRSKNLARGKDRGIFRVYRVQNVNGPWLWLVAEKGGAQGWVKVENIVPFEQAVDYYTNEIRANPSASANYNHRGNVWDEKHEYDIAIADYNEAIRLDPKDAVPYVSRGNAWANKKDYDHAIADSNEAIRLDPAYALAYRNRAVAWANKKDYDHAIADYNEAIRLDPKDASAYVNRGLAWSNKKDYDRAIADSNEAIRLDPKLLWAYLGKGVALLLAGRDGTSVATESGLEQGGWRSDEAPYLVVIGYLGHRQNKRDDQARVLIDQAVTKCDSSAWPFPVIRYLHRDIDESALLAAANDNDKMTEARAYLGWDLALSDKTEAAVPHLRWVQEHGNPSFIEYSLSLAELDRLEKPSVSSARP